MKERISETYKEKYKNPVSDNMSARRKKKHTSNAMRTGAYRREKR